MSSADLLWAQIIYLTRKYYKAAFPTLRFIPAENPVPYAGCSAVTCIRQPVYCDIEFWIIGSPQKLGFRDGPGFLGWCVAGSHKKVGLYDGDY